MKALTNLEGKELLAKIYESEKLAQKLDDYIQECEQDYIGDICRELQGCHYSIGFYDKNYMKVIDEKEFVYSVENAVKRYGMTEKIEKLVNTAKKLMGNNLFEYQVKLLCEEVLNHLNEYCKYVENVCYKIYIKEIDDMVLQYLECFADSCLDGMFINSQNEIVKIEKM